MTVPCSGRKNPTAPDGIDGLCTNNKGFPIGASSIPVGTRLSSGKSSVLYLCGADGSRNCSTPWKVRLQLRRSGGKGCPLRGSISDRKKAGRRCGYALSASLVICGTKVYQSPPSAAAYYRIRTTTAVSRAGCPSLLPPPSLSGSR